MAICRLKQRNIQRGDEHTRSDTDRAVATAGKAVR
jgi:hypothetical protein